MELRKVQVKILRAGKGSNGWVHLCYVPEDVFKRFSKHVNKLGSPTNNWLLKWALEDFGVTLKLETWNDLEALKNRIRELYKEQYPELYLDSATDNQGWVRVWYTKHMEKELNVIGK